MRSNGTYLKPVKSGSKIPSANTNGHHNGNGRSNGHSAPAMSPPRNGVPIAPRGPMRRVVDGFRMKTVSEEAFRVLGASVARLVDQGKRTIMITSGSAQEGKSTVTAALARKLARSGRLSVAVVDADTARPRQHDLLQVENRRGLGELLEDVYHVDLSREDPNQFGVGDWIELVRAQNRTGKLAISEGGAEFTILFNKGKVSSLVDHLGDAGTLLGEMLVAQGRITAEQRDSALRVQEEGSHPLGEVLAGLGFFPDGELEHVLQAQFKTRLHRILTMRQPQYRFSEMLETYLPAGSNAPMLDTNGSSIDRFVTAVVGDYLKQPYLASQVPSYLKDTALENLKVLTCGERSHDLCDAHFGAPFAMTVERLAKRFDVVLVDTPPVAFDSATADMAAAMDGVILVVKANSLSVGVVQQAKDHLLRSGANILGVVLNQVELFKDEALPYYHSYR